MNRPNHKAKAFEGVSRVTGLRSRATTPALLLASIAGVLLLSACDKKKSTLPVPTPDIPWNASITYDSMIDVRDGQVYKTVRIGAQTWMAQNLNYLGPDTAQIGVWYDNSADSGTKFGRLYNWAEAMGLDKSLNATSWRGSDEKHAGICPVGWHVPSDNEWTMLTDTTLPSSNAGLQLKAAGGWISNGNGSGNGSDASGFRALPGGDDGGAFDVAGINAAFWSASQGFSDYAWFRIIYNGSNRVRRFSSSKTYGFSLRCLMDD